MRCAEGFAELAQLPEAERKALCAKADASTLGEAMWLAPPEVYGRFEEFLPGEVRAFVVQERAFQGSMPDRYDPDSAESFPDLSTFEDLLGLTEREIQMTLREVLQEDLAMALRGRSEELSRFVFRNMSEAAQAWVRRRMEELGGTSVEEVEAARQRMVAAAARVGPVAVEDARKVVREIFEAQRRVVEGWRHG